MLVLTRKVDDKIMIGDDIELTVVRIDGNRVRIGINAPREMRILRGELAGAAGVSQPAEFELSEREFAFAHQNAAARISAAKATEKSQPESQLFVGTVSEDGRKVQLTSQSIQATPAAPLASFVSAS